MLRHFNKLHYHNWRKPRSFSGLKSSIAVSVLHQCSLLKCLWRRSVKRNCCISVWNLEKRNSNRTWYVCIFWNVQCRVVQVLRSLCLNTRFVSKTLFHQRSLIIFVGLNVRRTYLSMVRLPTFHQTLFRRYPIIHRVHTPDPHGVLQAKEYVPASLYSPGNHIQLYRQIMVVDVSFD